ncbi:protein diaphanous [Condylostylus longicornis]|uniref:protein diaphanous n=1 Tax=Condylostylus longicornis TaxID=2530218 RepID=UPI00244E25A3|nr:protein diaphanous [Condylostylus longicornis]
MSKHDKQKSGNLLESWFGRPKARSKNAPYAGGRPTSTDGELDLGDLLLEIKKLSDSEVDQRFIDILEDMNIPNDKRSPLLSKPISEKKDMIFMHLKGKNSLEHRSNSKFEKPNHYIEYLQAGEHSEQKFYQCIENLRVALTSNPISWIKEFGEIGINEIVNLWRRCKQERNYDRIEFECLRCLKAFMNNTWGLNLILKPDQHTVLLLLAQSLDPRKPHIMTEALKLLASFCLVPERNGYEKVLKAITNSLSPTYKNGERFRSIVDALFVDERLDSKRDLCCHSLIFINTITNTPSDLNFRLHLRCEIMRMGLHEKLENLTEIVEKSSNENLKKHFKIFNDIKEDDAEEFIQRFDNVKFELDDPAECFEVLKNLIVDTPSEAFFLSILQHLLYIRDDYYIRPAYYQLIEECVAQIVFHKSGCDPNFDNRNFHIDTSLILDDIVEKSKAKDLKRAEEFEKKYEQLEIAKQEAEARAADLEEKLKQIQTTGKIPSDSNSKPALNIPFPPPLPGGNMPPPPPPPPGGAGMGTGAPPPPPPFPGARMPPPPPPMPGVGGGPPPPPPPLGMGLRPPPPPMGGLNLNAGPSLPPGMKPKTKWNVKNPMKRANWKAIAPNKISENAFWIKCQEEKLASDDILSELSTRFTSKPIKVDQKDSVDNKPTTLKKNVIDLRVLDSKAAQNISILLGGSLKHMPYEEIRLCLFKCDTSILTPNILQQLLQYLPPPDQLKKLVEIKSKGEDLSNVERFIATIGDIKRLNNRLNSLNFKLTLPDMIQDIKPDIVAGSAACEEVKTSKKFAKILEIILLLGNYMNSGSKNEQAYGFEISFLTKLSNTKDFENKKTLMHYLAELVETKFNDVLDFYDDLTHVDKACRVSLETIQKTMRQINSSMKNLETDLNNNKVPQCEDDLFVTVMGKFAEECGQQVNLLGKMQAKMEKQYKELSEYFVFDPNKYNMEEFFGDIKTFKDSFIMAYQENVKIREEQIKAKRLLEAREQAQREMLQRQLRQPTLVDIDAAHTQEGVMDSLLEALQTGSAFGNRQKRRPRPAGAERRAQLSRSRSRTRINATNLATREMIANEIALHS